MFDQAKKLMLEGAISFVKDTLFPVFCASCGAEGQWWCPNCLKKQTIKSFNFLPKAKSPLTKVTAFFDYQKDSVAARLIKQFKYNAASDMQFLWQGILLAQQFSEFSGTTIIPVPLHPRRQRERGYNQAELLANILSGLTNFPKDSTSLVRRRYTKQQATLNKKERLVNVAGAFAWRGKEVAPLRALLIDDVYTTGATMGECAEVLSKNGTTEVCGLILARD